MANVPGNITDDLQDYIPNVCTNSPASGSAFCEEHCKLISGLGYPTGLREFLKSYAAKGEIDPENFTKNMQQSFLLISLLFCSTFLAVLVVPVITDGEAGHAVKRNLTMDRRCRIL